MNPDSPLILPRAVLFDMDGTLTEPMLDFPRIKAEMGIGNAPILEALAKLDVARRSEAEAILIRHEEIAARESRLNAGCRELLDWLRTRQIATALITRNSRQSATTVLQRHDLKIGVLITRENGPFKPSPLPLMLACERLKVDPQRAWIVGDGQYDVEAGNAARIRTMWISHGRTRSFAAEPWMTARDLVELWAILKNTVANDED
jgi:HAD superfamily hydrolase (TIGR01509 family)